MPKVAGPPTQGRERRGESVPPCPPLRSARRGEPVTADRMPRPLTSLPVSPRRPPPAPGPSGARVARWRRLRPVWARRAGRRGRPRPGPPGPAWRAGTGSGPCGPGEPVDEIARARAHRGPCGARATARARVGPVSRSLRLPAPGPTGARVAREVAVRARLGPVATRMRSVAETGRPGWAGPRRPCTELRPARCVGEVSAESQ